MKSDSTSSQETGQGLARFGERAEGRRAGRRGSGTPPWAFSSLGGCGCLTTARGFTQAHSWWNRNI